MNQNQRSEEESVEIQWSDEEIDDHQGSYERYLLADPDEEQRRYEELLNAEGPRCIISDPAQIQWSYLLADSDEEQRTSEELHQGSFDQWSDEEIDDHQGSYERYFLADPDEEQRIHEELLNAEGPRCIISDPAQTHKVSRVDGYETKQECFSCGERTWISYLGPPFHYYCPTCQVEFHNYCHDLPSKMIHPYHPQHPLTFTFLNNETRMIVDTNYREYDSIFSGNMPIEFQKPFVPLSNSPIIFDKCTWCGNDLGEWFYRCQICNFSLDLHCAKINTPLTIQNPKSHNHSLSLSTRPLSFPCDACGLINLLEPSYACYQCSYLVHKSCIDLPRVMKITRHPHRLSHTPFLPAKVSICRICYKNVDIKYGQYTCNREDCSYVVHSKCATDQLVWDGKELEWEPEESDETKDIAPYKKVGGDLIEHFGHDHHYLKLEKYKATRDSRKKCQACMRSITTSQDFYNCIECDYFLHEVCANFPRKLDHALHNHSLFLDPYPAHDGNFGGLECVICHRKSSGWKYTCKIHYCGAYSSKFKIDLNCILVPECFTHESHPEHLLFIVVTYRNLGGKLCQGCKKGINGYHLQCTICEFAICYKCSTIPNELYYKFDENPLSLCYGESGVDEVWWCEVCEERLDPMEWFYTNKERCTTIHHKCLFGDSIYLNSGHIFDYSTKVKVVSNSSSSRPTCHICQHHCSLPVYLRVRFWNGTVRAFCSFDCLDRPFV